MPDARSWGSSTASSTANDAEQERRQSPHDPGSDCAGSGASPEKIPDTEIGVMRATLEELEAALLRARADLQVETRRREQAEEAAMLRTAFIANISRESLNPLSLITLLAGNLDTLYDRLADDKRREMIRDIREQVRVLNDLIASALEVAQIASGRVSNDLQRVDVAQIVYQEVERQASSCERRSQRLRVTGLAHLAVLGNRDQLRRVIRTLLSNAIESTAEGGQITASCGTLTAGAGASAAWPGSTGLAAGRWAAVRVVDGGPGISPEDVPRVFDRVYRATCEAHVPGTGPGLALVEELVTLHGGHVAVASTPGKGSTFAFYLPLPSD